MQKALKRGFTLIELLIVIVVIGILATAVLSAINPIEQVRKANDAGKESDSAELLNALERHYATFQRYPWKTAAGAALGTVPPAPGTAGLVPAGQAWLTDATSGLVGVAEIKPEFANRKNMSSLLIYYNATSELSRVCYVPASSSNAALATYVSGVKDATCPKTGCQVCLPE